MPLYPFYFSLEDKELGMRPIIEREEFMVEATAHVPGGDLETTVEDVFYDGCRMADSHNPVIVALADVVKKAAIAELDAAGPLWSRVQEDLGLSYRETRGWRRAS